jgi:dTDP-4-dehydrorhamnose reductase
MTSRKMLVTGAGGMVGSYVPEVFTDYELVLTNTVEGYIHMDVRQPADVTRMVADLKPDVILHLAAATDVDQCERDPDEAFHTNAIGTQNIALACQEFDVPLVYVSTAGVFWGDKPDPYNEFDVPRPANVYGQSKLAGEHIVSSLLQRYYIVRAGWMLGGGAKDKKFVGQISRLMMQGTNPLKIVDDKIGSPTYAKDLLGGIHSLLQTNYYGLYHLVNQGQCSRYDVGLLIRDVLQRPDIKIIPVSSAYFPLPAPRARSEAMRNLKLELLGVHQMRGWQEALTEYIVTQLAPTLSTP